MVTVCEKENLDSTGVCDQTHLNSELPSLFDLSNEDFQSGKSANVPITGKMECIENCFFRQMDESVVCKVDRSRYGDCVLSKDLHEKMKSIYVPEGKWSGTILNFSFLKF